MLVSEKMTILLKMMLIVESYILTTCKSCESALDKIVFITTGLSMVDLLSNLVLHYY